MTTSMTYRFFSERITRTPPYRGTENRFPLNSRRQLNYYFIKEDEAGQTVFDVCYGHRWQQRPVAAHEIEALKAKNESIHQTSDGRIFVYEKCYNKVLRVRPDDSIEFIADDYHQGTRQFLDKLFYGHFVNDSRRGGVIYKSATKMLPIYRGLRVLPNMTLCNDVKVTTYTVDRKASRGLIKQYEMFFKAAEVMIRSITDKEVWAKTVSDIAKDHLGDERYPSGKTFNTPDVREKILKLMNTAPLDALVLSSLYYDVQHTRWAAEHAKYPPWYRQGFHMESLFNVTKRHIVKDLYKSTPKIFVTHTFPAGEAYGPTDWGVRITDNGVRVVQAGYSAN